MEAVLDATLSKWGNSQGLRIPKEVCDLLGVGVGSRAKLEVEPARSEIKLTFERPPAKYHRTRKVSMEELCADWQGDRVGQEWGGPDVGAEVVE